MRYGIVLIATGIMLLALSVLFGEGTVGVLLFIPFFYGTGALAFMGVLALMLGIFLSFGPIPIVLGTDVRTAVILMLLALALLVAMCMVLFLMR